MKIETKKEILEILELPEADFQSGILAEADQEREKIFGNTLTVTSMVGFTNMCKNQCLYCGMRAANSAAKRFRIPPEQVIALGELAESAGYQRIFLVAGEDPRYGFDNLLNIVHALKQKGMYVCLACGEFEKSRYEELADAGIDEYVLKFEMSNPESFNRLNPSTNFTKRMQAIETIRSLNLKLASGNIIDWPGQTVEELAEDILLMQRLEISWAPVIPYLPTAGTPLAAEGGPGSLLKLYKEIAILRLAMPGVNITAQQPGTDLKKGLSDPEGNLAAVHAGANMLFFDLLPNAQAQNFRVIDDRNISGTDHLDRIAQLGGFILKSEAS